MNDQQEHLSSSLVEPSVPMKANDPLRPKRLRRPGGDAGLLTFIAVGVILVLLSTAWSAIALLTSHQQVPLSRITSHPRQPAFTARQLPVPTPTPTPQTAQMVARVDRLLTGEVAEQKFSGAVLIAENGQVLLSKGYSMADWSQNQSNTPQTSFFLGSTTKEFTAAAILILQQQGKLHVQDQLCAHITPCPPAWQPITIHEMLIHTSGIPQLDDSQLSPASPQAWIASYENVPLAFQAGSQFDYCNVCYQILGYVIEQVSGKPYSQFLQQAIFDPLQMKNTSFASNYLSLSNRALGYMSWQARAEDVGWDLAPEWTFLDGAGLLHSTVEDLYRWDQALYAHTLLSQQTLNEAFTPYIASQYAGSSYGYGWFIAKSPVSGHRLIWHDGRIDGFRTYTGRYIDDGIAVIFLSNLDSVDELGLAHAIEQIIFAQV